MQSDVSFEVFRERFSASISKPAEKVGNEAELDLLCHSQRCAPFQNIWTLSSVHCRELKCIYLMVSQKPFSVNSLEGNSDDFTMAHVFSFQELLGQTAMTTQSELTNLQEITITTTSCNILASASAVCQLMCTAYQWETF